MEAMSVLEEFRQRRELLENLRVNAAKPRLKGMWDFLQKERETIKIISKIPPVDHLISKASPTKQIEAEAPDEIRAVGFYIMEECSKTNKRITEIINHLGIISKDQKLKRQNYADNAMTGFVNHALDFIEEELEKLAKTPRKKKSTKKTSSRSATKRADKTQTKQDERTDSEDVSSSEGSGNKNDVQAIIEEAARDGWKELNLSNRGITELAEEIGQLASLERLHLYGNQLKEVPTSFGELVSLTELNLHNNQLTEVPKEIFKLANLAWLNLSTNRLRELPKEIEKLERLERLFVSDNQLSSVPKEIGKLKSLRVLYLNNNQLTKVPKEIEESNSLIDIILKGNNISKEEVERIEGKVSGRRDASEMESPKDLESPKRRADVVGNVATIQIEGIGEKDRLGRDKLVKTLAGMFAQTECDNGFTMALLGDWGQGKSTVMDLLKKELNGRHKEKL